MQEYYEFVVSVRADAWTEEEARTQLQDSLDRTFAGSAPRVFETPNGVVY